MWPHASGRDVKDGGERAVEGWGLFPLNEALWRCEQHPPIVAALRDGWEWDGDWTWTSRRRGARRGATPPDRQLVHESGRPSVVGGGVD